MRGRSLAETTLVWFEHQVAKARATLARLEAKAQALAEGLMQDASTPPFGGGVMHTFRVYGACYGNPPLDGVDLILYVPKPQSPGSGSAVYAYVGLWRTSGGQASVFVPDYDLTLTDPATHGAAYAYVLVGLVKYAAQKVQVPPSTPSHDVILKPCKDYSLAPACYVGGLGSGAQVAATRATGGGLSFSVPFGGSGYGLANPISTQGGYDTGLGDSAANTLSGIAGAITGVTGPVTPFPFTGDASHSYATFTSGATPALIRGTLSNGGYPTWTIVNAGNGYPANSYVAVPTQTAPSFGRACSLYAQADGSGNITGVVVLDPGFRYTAATLDVTIPGSGDPISVSPIVSGGNLVGWGPLQHVRNPQNFGFTTTPIARWTTNTGAYNPALDTGGTISGSQIAAILAPDALAAVAGNGRGPDRYGCFGTIPAPIKLTGPLTSQFGTIDLGRGNLQCGPGNVYDNATVPRALVTGYYRWCWTLARGGQIIFSTTFSGGALAGVTIYDAGYGHAGVGLSVTVVPGTHNGYDGSNTSGDWAVFHFTIDPATGSATGCVIDHPGSGYADGTYRYWGSAEPAAGEWELGLAGFSTANDSGPTYPTSTTSLSAPTLFGGYDSIAWPAALPTYIPGSATQRVRPSSITTSPSFLATYDFTGVANVDGVIFQSGSRIVTLAEN